MHACCRSEPVAERIGYALGIDGIVSHWLLRSLSAVLVASAVWVWAPRSVGAQRGPVRDESVAVAGRDGELRALTRGPGRTVVRGTVASITRPSRDGARGRVMIDDGSGQVVHGFEYSVPAQVSLPLRVGDAVELSVNQVIGGPNLFVSIVVRSGSGELLMYWANSAGDEPLEGWRAHDDATMPGLRALPSTRAAGTFRRPIAIEHMGRIAFVPAGRWRRLRAPDGTWLITGQLTGSADRRARDSGADRSCFIVRAPQETDDSRE
jgi:hypothetical protein